MRSYSDKEGVLKSKVAYLGVFCALALIFSYIESLIPLPIGIPGVKLGLANLVVVIALYKMRMVDVFILVVARVLVSGFIFGNYFSILYSLAGAVFSFFAMCVLKKTDKFTVIGVSVIGGVFHNLGQILVAIFVVETIRIVYYFPVLMISGVGTGILIGVIAQEVLKRIQFIRIEEEL